jgi:hypothetical protein
LACLHLKEFGCLHPLFADEPPQVEMASGPGPGLDHSPHVRIDLWRRQPGRFGFYEKALLLAHFKSGAMNCDA